VFADTDIEVNLLDDPAFLTFRALTLAIGGGLSLFAVKWRSKVQATVVQGNIIN